MKDTIKWDIFKKEIHELEIGEERVFIIDGRATVIKLAEVDDLDRVHKGIIL